jgi:hypothetical protein
VATPLFKAAQVPLATKRYRRAYTGSRETFLGGKFDAVNVYTASGAREQADKIRPLAEGEQLDGGCARDVRARARARTRGAQRPTATGMKRARMRRFLSRDGCWEEDASLTDRTRWTVRNSAARCIFPMIREPSVNATASSRRTGSFRSVRG